MLTIVGNHNKTSSNNEMTDPRKGKGKQELTIERLLSLLVYEWQLSRTSPMGTPIGGIEMRGTETSIALKPLNMYERGCPPNFGAFYDAAKSLQLHGLEDKKEAFQWYARSRLHYSCSTVCVAFVEFVVPELKKRGIEELKVVSAPHNSMISLNKIKVKAIFFKPKEGKVHAFRIQNILFGEQRQVVEACGSHNNLQCSDTGMVFDPTLGQLTGSMKPATFLSSESFAREFCGELLHFVDAPDNDVRDQRQRDVEMAKMTRKPASHPKSIAKRVVDLFLSEESDEVARSRYCTNCLGKAADGKKLLRCARCNRSYYCSKYCQSLDWKSHKTVCCPKE